MEYTPTYDAATNMAFFMSQLDNMDPEVHRPITNVTWGSAINVRPGLQMSDESTSFQRTEWGSTGTVGLGEIPWITQNTTEFPTISITGERVFTPMRLAGHMITYTQLELEKAQRLRRNLDQEKTEALHEIYQLGIDRLVYVGDKNLDTTEHKCRGLLTSLEVPVTNADKDFATMTPDEMVTAINELIEMVWSATAYSLMPNKIILPPPVFVKLATTKYSSNAEKTILTYLKENCLATTQSGTAPDFMPVHWASSAGTDGKGRIMAYVNEQRYVRFNMVPIRRLESYIDKAMYYTCPYIWALGEVEFVRPQTAAYLDKVTK